MRHPVIVSVVLSSLFLVPAEVGIAQRSASRGVDVNAIHALWISIKNQLTGAPGAGPNGEDYFRCCILVLSLTDGITPDVTLRLTDNNGKENHLNGPLMRGSQIQFKGIPVSFTQNPFMLTFVVTTDPKTTHAAMPKIAPVTK